eukprot:TRINITY_DN8259_c0_g2_i1.p1 TRINITY_DN8259_c0_g2~~TRINITY_DN8259_c0_g2_i1.p1  ORF type:complete len:208 (-),score=38.95 TRINITY_DN8259_c0_g2_i1:126-749(-)
MSRFTLALSVLASLSAVGAYRLTRTPVTLIEWQGCPDCSKYGDELVEKGLKKGLGEIMELHVYLKTGSHPGIQNDPMYHPWVACANNITGASDKQYYWFQVAACANPGKTIDSCISDVGMPSALVAPVKACMSDTARSTALVEESAKIGNSYNDYPWPLVNGFASLPEPDTHDDNIEPLIRAVCKDSQAKPLPSACDAKSSSLALQF